MQQNNDNRKLPLRKLFSSSSSSPSQSLGHNTQTRTLSLSDLVIGLPIAAAAVGQPSAVNALVSNYSQTASQASGGQQHPAPAAVHSDDTSSSSEIAPPRPWEDWTVDNNFLVALNRWNRDNEHSKLTTVLRWIDNAIDVGKPFLDLIPNQPFPAGGLVKGLASLIQLGVVRLPFLLLLLPPLSVLQRMPELKKNAYDFAMQVVQEMTLLAAGFGDNSPGKWAQKAWEGLELTR
jgi:hypothetical protein